MSLYSLTFEILIQLIKQNQMKISALQNIMFSQLGWLNYYVITRSMVLRKCYHWTHSVDIKQQSLLLNVSHHHTWSLISGQYVPSLPQYDPLSLLISHVQPLLTSVCFVVTFVNLVSPIRSGMSLRLKLHCCCC